MKNWRIFFLLLLLFSFGPVSKAQQTHLFMNPFDYNQVDAWLNRLDVDFHTSVRPYRMQELKDHIHFDSLSTIRNYTSRFSRSFIGRRLFKEDILYVERKDFQAYLNPAFDFRMGYDVANKKLLWNNTRGFSLRGNIGKTFSFYTDFYENQNIFAQYVKDYALENNVIPGRGRFKPDIAHSYFDYMYASGYISYTPIKYVNIELGHGKNFIGNGYRSLLLSDNAAPAFYARITTQVWKIKIMNLWTQYIDNTKSIAGDALNDRKFSSTTYITYNVNKYFSFGLFENVMWSNVYPPTGEKRGFDMNYLNPIIFYRTVEFGLGSPDKITLGLDFKIRPHDSHQLYGQIMINELMVSALLGKPQKGWRGNKHGFQLGYKYFNMFGVRNLHFQAEFNYVRPYAYQHWLGSDYSHFSQPIAHTMGANFMEGIAFLRYQNQRFTAEGRFSYTIAGRDTAGLNFGGNILLQEQNIPNEYGNYVGQGLKQHIIFAEAKFGYIINPAFDFRIEAGATIRQNRSEQGTQNTAILFLGLRTRIPTQYLDF